MNWHRGSTDQKSDHDTRDDRYDEERTGRGTDRDQVAHDDRHARARAAREDEARDRFGGTNLGAAFFGWLVAVAMTVLLSGIVGLVATAVGSSLEVSRTEAEQEAGTIGLAAAVALAVVLLLAYYTGGYVAGRMSRFDGARQGLAVWLIGLLVTALAVGAGLLFGSQYNLLERVNLPQVPIPTDQLNLGGVVTALVIVLGTALAAMAGGKVGRRYHTKVDRALPRW